MISLIKRNKQNLYANTDLDKAIICSHLERKLENALSSSAVPVGNKNLVYFSIGGNELYISVLEMSLKSIVKFTPEINFDILFITQQTFVEKINALPCVQNLNINFCIVPETTDGISASMNKLRIFEYERINEYNKILFLDCDIICPRPLSDLFLDDIDPRYIQVAQRTEIDSNVLSDAVRDNGIITSLNHSLKYFTKEQALYIEKESPVPFNAGQFMFVNSDQMRNHFENILWLISVWPGDYFFEQSFMNFYFTLNALTKWETFNKKISFIFINPKNIPSNKLVEEKMSISNNNGKYVVYVKRKEPKPVFTHDTTKIDISPRYMLHFIGMTLNADAKISEITNFLAENNICL